MVWKPEIEELRRREKLAQKMGGEENVAKHKSRGKLPVRDRIDSLLDENSFHETGAIAGSATFNETGEIDEFHPANVVIGRGKINNRKVVISADDFTV